MSAEMINRAVMNYKRESRAAGVTCAIVPVCICSATSTTDPSGYDMPLLRMYKEIFRLCESDADIENAMDVLCCVFAKMGMTAPVSSTPGVTTPVLPPGTATPPTLPAPPPPKGSPPSDGKKVEVPYSCISYFVSEICSTEAIAQFKAISAILYLVSKVYSEVGKLKDLVDAVIAICAGKDGTVTITNEMIASLCTMVKSVPTTLPGVGDWTGGLSLADELVDLAGLDDVDSLKSDSLSLGKLLEMAKMCCGG